jgi:CDP-diacylglycerol---glycerol-3-phosphate 3-phosphatidyltransferase
MFTDAARTATRGLVRPIVTVLARLGISPTALTILGCLLHLGVAWLLGAGHLLPGGIALALAAAFDGLDGSLARLTGRASRAGAFLDSSLDRVSEILVFFGLLVYAQRAGSTTQALLIYVGIVGSLMVSYTRARSEALGAGTRAGVFGRLERTVVLALGLVFGQLTLALWVLAIGTSLTAAQRVVDGFRRCRAADA